MAAQDTEAKWRSSAQSSKELPYPSKAQGTMWKEEWEEEKSWKILRRAVKCRLVAMTQPIMILQQLSALELHKTGSFNSQS